MRTLLKMDDYEATSWGDSEMGASERTLTYRVPLNANLGPKWAEVIEKQVGFSFVFFKLSSYTYKWLILRRNITIE